MGMFAKIMIATYAAMAVVTFGVMSASVKPECAERAYDPMKCRVSTGIPAAIFWPFAVSYLVADSIMDSKP